MKRGFFSIWVFSLSFLFLTACSRSGSSKANLTPEISLVKVSSTTPVDGASDISPTTEILVNFTDGIEVGSITPATLTLFHAANQVAGTTTATSHQARFQPSSPLQPDRIYTATLRSTVKDAKGKSLGVDFVWKFKTISSAPLSVLEVFPFPGTSNVFVDSPIQLKFSRPIDPQTVTPSSLYLNVTPNATLGSCPSLNNVPGSSSVNGDTITFQAQDPFLPSQTNGSTQDYSIVVTTNVKDLTGKSLAQTFCSSFKSIDVFGPVVTATSPEANANDVDAGLSLVEASFNERLLASTVSESTVHLEDELGFLVPASVSYDDALFKISLFPSYSTQFPRLTPNSIFTAMLNPAIQDFYANPLDAPFQWSFRTPSGWFVPIEFDAGVEDATDLQMATDPNTGRTYAIWLQDRPGTTAAGVYASEIGYYPDPAKIMPLHYTQTEFCMTPRLTIAPNGTVYFAWSERLAAGNSDDSILVRTLSPDGVLAETEALDIDGFASGSDAISPQIVCAADSVAHLLFAQNGSIYTRRRTSAGVWQSPVAIDDDAGVSTRLAQNARIAIHRATGDVVAVFQQALPGTGTVRNGIYACYRPAGGAWVLPPTLIDNGAAATLTTQDANNPQIAMAPDGTAHVAFLQKTGVGGTQFSVLTNRRTAGPSGTWFPGASLVGIDKDGSNSGLNCNAAISIDVDSTGKVHLIYPQLLVTGSVFSLMHNELLVGSAWSLPVAIDLDGTESINSATVSNLRIQPDNKVNVVFSQRIVGESFTSIHLTQLPASGGVWSVPFQVDADLAAADKAVSAYDPVGDALRIGWQQNISGTGNANSILVNLFR